ncbi:MAG TPA: NAD(P)/FAD-dependent oxidoreductase [Candidatus Eisenbacteria bacterium]|nr:NAD(P)/FAD-dependent oxidoreductase [Candidatus Eisenbacteria bacterium]
MSPSASPSTPHRVVILGGGFAGVYTALELERALRHEPDLEVVLVNSENFFLFTPMLHEVAASDLDLTHIVNPIRKLLRRVRFFNGAVEEIDFASRTVSVSHGSSHHHHTISYDQLVLALGSVTNFYGLPGLEERAVTMKTLGDAIHLRNQLIANLEEADFECCAHVREPLLTIVVAGGGFAGVETIAGVNDFLREAVKLYGNLHEKDLRVVLVHSGPAILPELGPDLGGYAERKLTERGVEIRTNTRVAGVSDDGVLLGDGSLVRSHTVVWTAGTSPHPLIAGLPCLKDRGRIRVNEFCEVPEWPGVWALGDCASIPAPGEGQTFPPTAQHAIREAAVVARNLLAGRRGVGKKAFRFRGLGQLAAIGRRTGVARIGGIQFSGFAAWWLWRTIYLSKLPRLEKKLRVMLDWTLDIIFSKDLVQFMTLRARTVSHVEGTAPALPGPVDRALVEGPGVAGSGRASSR